MLRLPSLHISGFKGFAGLRVERLGRVNLIVGKNNAGKTSLLEAIHLYAMQGSPNTLLQVLWNRHELRSWIKRRKMEEESEDPNPSAFARLFHGCYAIKEVASPITIGPVGCAEETLTMEFSWQTVDMDDRGQMTLPLFELSNEQRPVLEIRMGSNERGRIFLDMVWNSDYRRHLRNPWARREDRANSMMVPPSGFEDERLGWLWDGIAATDLEEAALDALRLIDTRVERLYFVRDDNSPYDRVAVLKLKDVAGPVPLRTLGDGMNRVLGILLAVARSRGGIVLIDELENGIHYSVLSGFLKILFRVASDLHVQVFATTHSWDCIEAFQEAATEDQQEGYLVRLKREDSGVQATVFDEALLTVVTRQDIEVR